MCYILWMLVTRCTMKYRASIWLNRWLFFSFFFASLWINIVWKSCSTNMIFSLCQKFDSHHFNRLLFRIFANLSRIKQRSNQNFFFNRYSSSINISANSFKFIQFFDFENRLIVFFNELFKKKKLSKWQKRIVNRRTCHRFCLYRREKKILTTRSMTINLSIVFEQKKWKICRRRKTRKNFDVCLKVELFKFITLFVSIFSLNESKKNDDNLRWRIMKIFMLT